MPFVFNAMPARALSPSLFGVAEDGQQMFLHPVNVRCLLREYGSLENSPQSISATVVEIEGHTVNEVRLLRFINRRSEVSRSRSVSKQCVLRF